VPSTVAPRSTSRVASGGLDLVAEGADPTSARLRLSTLPLAPIESTEPAEPIDRIEPDEPIDRIELDEPIAGVNPALGQQIAEHLRALLDDGLTFLIIEHHMDVIARLCEPVIVMAEGRHLAEGSFAEVAANPEVQEAYMGRRKWAS